MATVIVTAKRRFWYGRDVFPGQQVAMTPVDAAVHARAGRVSLAKVAATYRTTAMVAEPVAPPVVAPSVEPLAVEPVPVAAVAPADSEPDPSPEPAAEPSPAPSVMRARRTYRRRDLTATPTQQPDGRDA